MRSRPPAAVAKRLPHGIIAALLYLVLAIAQTWPLSIHLTERITHDPGDPLLLTYLLNWNSRVLPLTESWWHPPFFWPAQNTITLSDSLIGLAPAAWLLTQIGANAPAVYNILFITALWIAPLAAYWLVHALTRDAAASFIAGLAFGFAPYRAAQLSHLQLLFVPAVPLVFFALHRANADGRMRWVALAAGLWLWQGLTSLYFLLFIPLAVLLWLLWFGAWNRRLALKTAAVFAFATLAAAPVMLRYRESHAAGAHVRDLREVVSLSADVSDLGRATLELAIDLAGPAAVGSERALFPGFTVLLLALVACTGVRFVKERFRPVTTAFLVLFGVAAVLTAVAIVAPARGSVAGVDVSLSSPHKPMTVAWLAALGALLTSKTVSGAWKERSLVVGYALIALALWILSLGPEPTVSGSRIWYRSPYWLLYEHVPGFDGVRVPARLWTIVTLCFAVVAGLGAQRLLRGKMRPIATIAIAAAILAEGSIALHFDPLPHPILVPREAEVVLELPAGDPYRDVAAMYRSLSHQRPVLNGYSGYVPAAYFQLLNRIGASDVDGIIAAANGKRLAVVLHPPLDASSPVYQAVVARADMCVGDSATTTCLLRAPRR